MKAAIIGYSGAGKSTLAKRLGARYRAPVLHMDAVHFAPGWVERPDENMKEDVRAYLCKPAWVVDGNYRQILWEERMAQADRIFFLNFSRARCTYQIFQRYLQFKGRSRDSMSSGCEEKMDWDFIKWIWRDGRTKAIRDGYEDVCTRYAAKIVVLRNTRERDAVFVEMETVKEARR